MGIMVKVLAIFLRSGNSTFATKWLVYACTVSCACEHDIIRVWPEGLYSSCARIQWGLLDLIDYQKQALRCSQTVCSNRLLCTPYNYTYIIADLTLLVCLWHHYRLRIYFHDNPKFWSNAWSVEDECVETSVPALQTGCDVDLSFTWGVTGMLKFHCHFAAAFCKATKCSLYVGGRE